jgi:hypothetical protein
MTTATPRELVEGMPNATGGVTSAVIPLGNHASVSVFAPDETPLWRVVTLFGRSGVTGTVSLPEDTPAERLRTVIRLAARAAQHRGGSFSISPAPVVATHDIDTPPLDFMGILTAARIAEAPAGLMRDALRILAYGSGIETHCGECTATVGWGDEGEWHWATLALPVFGGVRVLCEDCAQNVSVAGL